MEFPDLGKQCSNSSCKQLDFLPMKCDACSQIFCRDHISYSNHSCPESYKKDNQVPVCPLCNLPIPIKKGDLPDVVVGRHIDNDCQSDPAKSRRKVYTNKCSAKGCKQKELVPVQCEKCRKNFCLKHRHEQDHNCQGFQGSGRGISNAGAAAMMRSQANSSKSVNGPTSISGKSKPQQTSLQQFGFGKELDRQRQERTSNRNGANPHGLQAQPRMTEDEAMALAIQASLAESQSSQSSHHSEQTNKQLTRQEMEDLQLAQAIAASQMQAQQEQRRRRERQESEKSCEVC